MRTTADRLASVAWTALCGFNMLFLAAFVLSLLAATRQAPAQEIACTGTDMLAAMASDDPEMLAAIRAEAATVANGDGRLWRISTNGAEDSYLFGTMHMSDPRIASLPPAAEAAFVQADALALEITEVMDEAAMAALAATHTDYLLLTDGSTLPDLIPEPDRAMVEAALAERGLSLDGFAMVQPWVLSGMIALPACETARQATDAQVLDVVLGNRARDAGKELHALETLEDQLGVMAGMPTEFHVAGLVETLRLGSRIEDVMETMVSIYLSGETGLFWPFFEAVLPSGEDGTGYAEFQERLITARNRTMAEGAAPLVERGNAFIAVGALHLAGDDGLVALLQQKGFEVEAVD